MHTMIYTGGGEWIVTFRATWEDQVYLFRAKDKRIAAALVNYLNGGGIEEFTAWDHVEVA